MLAFLTRLSSFSVLFWQKQTIQNISAKSQACSMHRTTVRYGLQPQLPAPAKKKVGEALGWLGNAALKKHVLGYCYVLKHQIHPENKIKKKTEGLATTEVTLMNLLLHLDLLSWLASQKWFYLSRKHHQTDSSCSRSKRWQVANWFISPVLYKLWQNQLF